MVGRRCVTMMISLVLFVALSSQIVMSSHQRATHYLQNPDDQKTVEEIYEKKREEELKQMKITARPSISSPARHASPPPPRPLGPPPPSPPLPPPPAGRFYPPSPPPCTFYPPPPPKSSHKF